MSGAAGSEVPETVARADSAVGEVALRRRGSITELIVNGAFVMDTVDVSTEVELATRSLSRHPAPRRVLVGGLGLGFTAAAVLADSRVERVTVVEIAEPLVKWALADLLPTDLRDPRLRLETGDVADVLARRHRLWHLILLDVDNGPGFLVHPGNAGLYTAAGVRAAYLALAPGGVLAIWSSHLAPELGALLREVSASEGGGEVEEEVREIERDGRTLEYAIYLLTRADPGAARCGRIDLVPSPKPE